MTFLAASSYPSPIDTFSQSYLRFLFDRSSIDDVGSAPADNKNRTGSNLVVSPHMVSIGYDIGAVNSFPNVELMN